MKNRKTITVLLLAATALPVAGLVLASKSPSQVQTEKVARGKYLVNYGGCNDCHTPLKLTDKGPVPDRSRLLSGHPESMKLPPPELKPGPWFAATAGMTAWAGPWGVSYAANLTPDRNTGLGIWSEAMFLKAMKTGKHMGTGRDILPPMPWQGIATLTDDDLKAIFAYLRTVPPVSNTVPAPCGPNGEAGFE
jgi:mono/diheme cytochrome c family protein